MAHGRRHETTATDHLRIALIVGNLGRGGAEKQLVYMARALRDAGADVRVYSLTRGGLYEPHLRDLGIVPRWIGWFGNPLLRLASLTAGIGRFRPHIVQSAHFFCNLYVGIYGRLCGALAIGAMRNELAFERQACGRWTGPLLRVPSVIIANSRAARRGVDGFGVRPDSIVILDNAIDLNDFDHRSSSGTVTWSAGGRPIAMAIGRMCPEKRFDRFLEALARARHAAQELRGIIVGDGPEEPDLRRRAVDLGLLPNDVLFPGWRDDVPALLRQADMLVLSSDYEGFPNVILEAMAARLPVITTPAGDAGVVVEDGISGYVVPSDDIAMMADRMVRLASSQELRRELGAAGRRRVEQCYSFDGLAERLITAYETVARRLDRPDVLAAIAGLRSALRQRPGGGRGPDSMMNAPSEVSTLQSHPRSL